MWRRRSLALNFRRERWRVFATGGLLIAISSLAVNTQPVRTLFKHEHPRIILEGVIVSRYILYLAVIVWPGVGLLEPWILNHPFTPPRSIQCSVAENLHRLSHTRRTRFEHANNEDFGGAMLFVDYIH